MLSLLTNTTCTFLLYYRNFNHKTNKYEFRSFQLVLHSFFKLIYFVKQSNIGFIAFDPFAWHLFALLMYPTVKHRQTAALAPNCGLYLYL